VLKALALGANACSVGRAYLYGLAAGGEQGVAHALGLLRAEIERGLALLGCASFKGLRHEHVTRREPRPRQDARAAVVELAEPRSGQEAGVR
jgi:L-lactate dehydrogenase (cytochrome)